MCLPRAGCTPLQGSPLISTCAFCSSSQRDARTATSPACLPSPLPPPPRPWQPILIVAPTSVLENWEREFERWGSFRVARCHGGQRERSVAGILAGRKEVMIVSYGTLR